VGLTLLFAALFSCTANTYTEPDQPPAAPDPISEFGYIVASDFIKTLPPYFDVDGIKIYDLNGDGIPELLIRDPYSYNDTRTLFSFFGGEYTPVTQIPFFAAFCLDDLGQVYAVFTDQRQAHVYFRKIIFGADDISTAVILTSPPTPWDEWCFDNPTSPNNRQLSIINILEVCING
jgi:hypothetical protein